MHNITTKPPPSTFMQTTSKVIIFLVVAIFCTTSASTRALPYETFSEATTKYEPPTHHGHIIPTLLFVEDHITGETLNALKNSLYDELEGSTFVVARDDNNNKLLRGTKIETSNDAPFLETPDKKSLPSVTNDDDSLLNPWRILRPRDHDKMEQYHQPDESPIFWANKKSISFHSPLVLSWNDDIVHDDDVITLHCPADDDDDNNHNFKDAATIIQARHMGRRRRRNMMNDDDDDDDENVTTASIHNDYNVTPTATVFRWEISSFPIIRENTCDFRLWTRMTDEPNKLRLLSKTETITVRHGTTLPTAIHLSLTSSPDEINIHFTTGGHYLTSDDDDDDDDDTTAVLRPVVEYYSSTPTDDDDQQWLRAEGTSDTYTASDMCESPANITAPGKFTDPGLLHTVSLSNLDHDTRYFYRVGVVVSTPGGDHDNVIWSSIHNFKSPSPPPDELSKDYEIAFIVYGDQGVFTTSCCKHALETIELVTRDVTRNDDIRAIHHIGDLSYALGAAHLWDAWFASIQRFTTTVPLMVGIGNHEYDHTTGGENGIDPSGERSPGGFHPRWGNMGNDSGGECGVPVAKRFRMPSGGSEGSRNNNGVFWYSYDMGMVHVVMISSEHDLGNGSRQYEWLTDDLTRVNRTVTPWIVVECHRPMYHSEALPDNNAVGVAMRNEFEDVLYDYDVDLFLSGHYHSYLRTCRGLYRQKCDNDGTLHVTVGTAGFFTDVAELYDQDWTEVYLKENGYGRIEVNRTQLMFEFVGDDQKAVLDRVILNK